MAKTTGSLSLKHQRFVAEYLVDLNATQAAIRAGYSAKTAEQQGPRLLGNAGIAQAIQKAQEVRAKRTGITQDRVLEELSLLAFSSIDHYQIDDFGNVTVKDEAPDGAIRAVASVKKSVHIDKKGNVTRDVELRLWDKPGPLKLAGQHVGLFTKKVELSGSLEVRGTGLEHLTEKELADVERVAAMVARKTT